jgi:hypothetical protein
MNKIGPFPIVTEQTIKEPGWYWFEPTHPGTVGGRPRFMLLDEEDISDGWAKCRMYEGRYAGPFEPPDMTFTTSGTQAHILYKVEEV